MPGNNADLLVQMLAAAGVRWVFGIPSGPVLPLVEALRKSEIEFVLTASETSAGFMASVVGHLTGTPGVCVATLGPGATNLATGVGAAWLDRSPVLAITCNVATPWLLRRTQMRIDHHALFAPLTKASFALTPESLAADILDALTIAQAEPPGPVHLDLPEDVGLADAAAPDHTLTLALSRRLRLAGTWPSPQPLPQRLGEGAQEVVDAIVSRLVAAQRPLVVTGLTFTRSQARPELLAFIERQQIPFVSTLHGKGFLPETHPNWCGVIGRARRSDVAAFVRQADLIMAIGYDPIEINYEEWVGETPVIHLSTEPAEVGPDLQLVLDTAANTWSPPPRPGKEGVATPTDAVDSMDAIIQRLAALPAVPNRWNQDGFAVHRRHLAAALRPPGPAFGPHQVIDLLRERLPPHGILTCDIGAHTHQIATQWQTDQPWTCLSTNGWSSMGFGMPAAYAAKLVHPDRPVAAIVGDGGFQMTAGELALARRLQLAVPLIVLNDGWLGLMKVKQEHGHYPLYGVRLGDPVPSPPHYFGVPCRPAHNVDELSDALEWAFALDGPSVIEAFIDAAPYSQTVFD